MKRILLSILCLFLAVPFAAETYAQNNDVKECVLRPEFTVRGALGFFQSGASLTSAVRLNGKHAVGLWLAGTTPMMMPRQAISIR